MDFQDLPQFDEAQFDEAQFDALVQGMVTENAPTVFAVVQKYDDHSDARVAAWGLAFPDHAEVVSVEGSYRMSTTRPENALRAFTEADVTADVVWA